MQENEFQDLTSLMKVRFGVTKSSPLRLTEKDTLFTAFRKIADNIYKNGEWTVEDEIQAVDTMMRNRNDVAVGTNRISYYAGRENGYLPMTIDVAPITDIERSRLGSRADNFSGYTATVTKQLPDGFFRGKKDLCIIRSGK
ncbi:hypothetical protein [uncultured Enterococcus sp.]|uniref:hypothetical protein n=1 Tax=uncultured Enterococcus sp. TaxID=167972 RepID=UPI002AA62ECB|nr:hypothetical protein [uncultured Enterococcus sp.]